MVWDLVIIGGGAAYEGAIRAASLGLRVAVVERERLGGAWLHAGCVPLKILFQGATAFKRLSAGEAYGVRNARAVLDFEVLLQRKAMLRAALQRRITEALGRAGVTVFAGEGSIPEPGRVRVRGAESESLLETRNIVLATGSHPRRTTELQPDGVRVLTTDEALDLEEVPQSVCIVGGGASGCEFASFYAAMGSQVVLLEREPALLPSCDIDLGRELTANFAASGALIYTNVTSVMTARAPDGVTVDYVAAGQRQSATVEKVVLAVGRSPNSHRLGLDALGVRLDGAGFVEVDAGLQTSVPGVFAIGDVKGEPMAAHLAAYESVWLAERLASRQPAPLPYGAVARVIDGLPQVATVGLSEGAARERYGAEVRVRRARATLEATLAPDAVTYLKLVFAPEGPLVGAHLVGAATGDAVALLAGAVRAGWKTDDLKAALVPHLSGLPLSSLILHDES